MTETWTNGWGKEGTTCRVIYLRVGRGKKKTSEDEHSRVHLPLSKN